MVRLLKNDEKQDIASLYERVFVEDEEAYRQYFYDKILPVSDVMVYTNDTTHITGMLTMIPKKVSLGGCPMICRYIYGVATDISFRRQGIMGKVMTETLRYLKDECFTYLIPSSEENAEIYKKYGFAHVMDKCVGCENNGVSRNGKKAEKSDISRLASFAEKYCAKHYDVYLKKDEIYFIETFEKMTAENGFVEIFEEEDVVRGYRVGFEDETIEMIPSCKCGEMKPYLMVRILNIEKIMPFVKMKDGCEGVTIRIIDPVIRENNRLFKIASKSCENMRDGMEYDYMLDIGAFAAHIFGYDVIEELPFMGLDRGVFINDYL